MKGTFYLFDYVPEQIELSLEKFLEFMDGGCVGTKNQVANLRLKTLFLSRDV